MDVLDILLAMLLLCITVVSVLLNVFVHPLDDHSRVTLPLTDEGAGSDYINASYIDVSDALQGEFASLNFKIFALCMDTV